MDEGRGEENVTTIITIPMYKCSCFFFAICIFDLLISLVKEFQGVYYFVLIPACIGAVCFVIGAFLSVTDREILITN